MEIILRQGVENLGKPGDVVKVKTTIGPRSNPPHGTTARYRGTTVRLPCHCDECKTAWTSYHSARRKPRA